MRPCDPLVAFELKSLYAPMQPWLRYREAVRGHIEGSAYRQGRIFIGLNICRLWAVRWTY